MRNSKNLRSFKKYKFNFSEFSLLKYNLSVLFV